MQLEPHQLDLRFQALRVRPSHRELSSLALSLGLHGQQSPILVVAEGERFVVADGFVRLRALRLAKIDTVEATVLEMSAADALILTHRAEAGRRPSALEEGWLVAELVSGAGLSQDDVALRLGRSKGWVSQRLHLAMDLPKPVQDAVAAGKLPARATARFLTRFARANRTQCTRLVERLTRPVTDRETEYLFSVWNRAKPPERERIVDNPGLLLEVAKAARSPPSARGDPLAPALRELRQIEDLSATIARRLDERLLDELDEERLARFFRVANSTMAAAIDLMTRLSQEELDRCSTTTHAQPFSVSQRRDEPFAGLHGS